MFGQFSKDNLEQIQQEAEKVGLTTTAYYAVNSEWDIAWIKTHREGEPPEYGITAASLEQAQYQIANLANSTQN